VTANDGQTAVCAVNVAVTGQLKIGNLSFTVTDLAVPVLGIPIQIDRTYDNFRRSGGDFGVDWTLGPAHGRRAAGYLYRRHRAHAAERPAHHLQR